jgi:hypothetical protein
MSRSSRASGTTSRRPWPSWRASSRRPTSASARASSRRSRPPRGTSRTSCSTSSPAGAGGFA